MTVKSDKRLSPKQQRFVEEYLVDCNGTQAAIRAGYSAKTAYSIAAEHLSKPVIAEAIAAAKGKRSEQTGIDAAYVLHRLHEIDQLDVLDILDDAGNLKPILQWPKAWRQTISGLDVQEMLSGEMETIVRKIKWPDKLRNLELLGKHVGVGAFRDQIVIDDASSLAEKLAAARKRANKP